MNPYDDLVYKDRIRALELSLAAAEQEAYQADQRMKAMAESYSHSMEVARDAWMMLLRLAQVLQANGKDAEAAILIANYLAGHDVRESR